MRRALRALLASLLSLPTLGSALIIASLPPVSRAIPPALLGPLRDAAALLFELVATLPPDSLAGRAFYGTYSPLVPIFGAHALAAHSLLLSLPFLLAAFVAAFRPARDRGSQASRSTSAHHAPRGPRRRRS